MKLSTEGFDMCSMCINGNFFTQFNSRVYKLYGKLFLMFIYVSNAGIYFNIYTNVMKFSK